MAPPRGGIARLNERITQNIDTEGMSLWLCEQRLRRVIIVTQLHYLSIS